jgi:glutamine synthetase
VGYFPSTQNILLQKLLELIEKADKTEKELQEIIIQSANLTGTYKEKAVFVRDVMLLKMQELRSVCDELEIHVRKRYWPFPTYAELLFEV